MKFEKQGTISKFSNVFTKSKNDKFHIARVLH